MELNESELYELVDISVYSKYDDIDTLRMKLDRIIEILKDKKMVV